MAHQDGAVYDFFRRQMPTEQVPIETRREPLQTFYPLTSQQAGKVRAQLSLSEEYNLNVNNIHLVHPPDNFPSGIEHFTTVGEAREIAKSVGGNPDAIDGVALATLEEKGLRLRHTDIPSLIEYQQKLVAALLGR